MNGRVIRPGLGLAAALAVLGLCLFGDCPPLKNGHILAPALAEVAAVLGDPGTQWMLFVCSGMYFVGFAVLRRSVARAAGGGEGRAGAWWNASSPGEVWLAGLMVVAALAYAFDYAQAVRSTQALTLLGGAMIGQAVVFFESRKQKVESRNGGGTIVLALIILLAGAAVWQGETGHVFQYRGQGRWSGPWDNPNTFGMLMGVGVVLSLGMMNAEGRTKNAGRDPNVERRTFNWGVWVSRGFLLAAAGVMGLGLLKSYSRGAWVGTALGLLWLGIDREIREIRGKRPSQEGMATDGVPLLPRILSIPRFLLSGHSVALATMVVSVGILAFWSFRDTEWRVARRAYTVANANDFSWRKRVAAYEGALQMMADRPCFGFGWNQPERVYDQYYRAAKVDEGMAIQLNDYLMLGTTLGLPALLCFVMYVGLALAHKSQIENQKSQMSTICRAGALVLLVGFWFDGGLFKLATASTFWILLELGKEGNHERHEAHETAPENRGLRGIRGRMASAWSGFRVFSVFRGSIPLSALCFLLFLLGGALFWAKGRDPFQRVWFQVRVPGQAKAECIAVLPKMAPWPLPVVVYLHGSGGSLLASGIDLRQIAEMGLAAVGMDYCQTNEAAFDAQFSALLDHLRRQPWADTNRTAWVGYSLGAQRLLAFALQHPGRQPKLLVRLAGGWIPELEQFRAQHPPIRPSTLNSQPSTAVLLIHGERDEVFPLAQAERVAACLRTNGVPVELKVLPGEGHGFGANRLLVFRVVGEQCLTRTFRPQVAADVSRRQLSGDVSAPADVGGYTPLKGPDAFRNYRSILSWQAQTKPLWLFWTPALVWAVVWMWLRRNVRQASRLPLRRASVPASPFLLVPGPGGTPALRWLAAILATAALAQTALHLVPPRLPASDLTLRLARKHLVQAKEMGDFGFLAAQPVWRGKPLKALLEHVELAHYNRELVNWKLDEQIYRDFVLSPLIEPLSDGELNWRRLLWENFYPRIRREQDPAAAAEIVARFLRERVTVAQANGLPSVVAEAWQHQVTNERGFEVIYVAALRSVGVPARLGAPGRAEFWTGSAWQPAPRPLVDRWQ